MKKLPLYEIFRSLPVSRLLLSGIIGILLVHALNIEWIHMLPVLLLLLSLVTILLINNWFVVLHLQWLRGVLLSLLIVLVFAVYTNQREPEIHELPESWYQAEVLSFPQHKAKSLCMTLNLLHQLDTISSSMSKVKMISYFKQDDDLVLLLKPGDKILLKIKPEVLRNQGNPYEFDYASYLRSREIYYTGFIEGENHVTIRKYEAGVRFLPEYMQKFIMDRILLCSKNEDSVAVLLAICLGSKDFLDRDLKTAYTNAGGIHVMAVSGLHVGLIWLFLGYLFSFMGKGRRGEFLRAFLSIFILWLYALMTGLSPSVTRSALMFSLINIGKVLNRQSSIYNSLMIAAFFQLSFKPDSLFDPGFQFSYMAVFSIVYFHPLIRGLFPEKNLIFNKLLDLSAVSISAQILTFPLAIFYFNQFPLFFLLTNFILIPLVTILMTVFIISCFFLGFPLFYKFLVSLMIEVTDLMNSCMLYIDSVPGGVIEDIYINDLQIKLLLLAILFFIHFRVYRVFRSFFLMQLSIFLFFGLTLFDKISAYQTNELVVYNCSKIPCIGLHLKSCNYIISTELSKEDSLSVFYATENNRIRNFRKPPVILKIDSLYNNLGADVHQAVLPDGYNFIWKTKYFNFIIVNNLKSFSELEYLNNISIDLVILADPVSNSFISIDTGLNFTQWVISSAVPWYVKPDSTWIENQSEVHDVRLSKAYVYKESY
jgi:competence protein ComEC